MIALPLLAGWLCLLLAAVLIALRPARRNLPPGPMRLPIIDNLLDMPPKDGRNWEHYSKQKELYGPITSLTAFGTNVVLLHDLRLAQDFLEKRAVVVSGRPRPFFLTEMCGWNNNVGFAPYDRRLRAMRKHFHSVVGVPSALADFGPMQDIETRRFLLRILHSPAHFLHHVRSEAAGIMLKSIYGYSINMEGSDSVITILSEAIEGATKAGQPGAWLVDSVPALRHLPDWLPGTAFKRFAREVNTIEKEFSGRPWEFVKQEMTKGTHESSFVSRLHERAGGELTGEDAHIAKYAANALYGGGADTTVSSIMTFFLLMIHNPSAQVRAQEEIDRVVGHDRLPALEDRGSLPYTEALISEVLRFHPVAPEGLPHTATEDCEFEGYYIPKDTIVIPNLWLFGHDPKIYHDPFSFNPDRFLGDAPELDPRSFIFGFGRRVCPGQLLANSNLFLTLVRTLAAFEIRKPLDEEGHEYTPLLVFDPGFISHPAPFEARVMPRSEKYRELIMEVEKTHPIGKGSAEDLEDVKVW